MLAAVTKTGTKNKQHFISIVPHEAKIHVFDIPRWDIQEDESGENNSTRLLKYSESQRKANPPRRVANIMALCSAGG